MKNYRRTLFLSGWKRLGSLYLVMFLRIFTLPKDGWDSSAGLPKTLHFVVKKVA
jgi:hypothetical protein